MVNIILISALGELPMVVCPANILFFITVNTLLKNINLEFYFSIYMYDCLHISRYGCTQGVCVCFGGGKYVYIYTYIWVCVYMGIGAVTIASLRRLKEAQLSVLDFLL